MSQSTFNLPDLGEGLTEAELTRWLVSEGDQIVVDQPIAEVETAKALVEVPSPYAGTVATLHGAEGQTMIVGEPLITVSTAVPADQGSGPEGVSGVPDDGPSPGALSYREEERAGMEIPAADGAETTPDLDRVRGGDAGGGAAERAAETGEATRTAPDRGEGTAASDPETEGSGSVLIGYGTSGHGAGGRTRPKRQRPRWTESATSAAAPTTPGASTGLSGASAAEPGASSDSSPAGAPRVVSPIVRRLAKDLGVDLTAVRGTGPHGLILRRDVEQVAGDAGSAPSAAFTTSSTQPTAAGAADTQDEGAAVGKSGGVGANAGETDQRSGLGIVSREPMRGVRKAVAEQMVRSRTQIPEATAWLDVDVTRLVELRAELKQQDAATAPSLLALIARFTTAALRRYPIMNSRVEQGSDGESIVQFDGINLGLAAQTDRGLVVPSIERADQYSARELHEQIAALVERAREGKCTPAELTRGTFTLNNYGVFGTDGAAAIINAPEVAILGVGRIIDRPWVVEGEIVVRKVTELTLSFDHRVTDGGTASAFLTTVARCLENPGSALADL